MSLSTATPSLGGAPPKLATWKIGYETPRYDRLSVLESQSVMLCAESRQFSKRSSFMRPRAKTSLSSNGIFGEDEEDKEISNTVNVLATQTEASMSSTSFAIPRRSTVDADVSFFVLFH